MFDKQEDLIPELEAAIQQGEQFDFLSHKLVMSVPFFRHKGYYAYLNDIYHHKEIKIAEALEEQDYFKLMWLHERPYRLEAFIDYESLFSDEQYWQLLAEVWIDSENPLALNQDVWEILFSSKRNCQHKIMSEDEYQDYLELPNVLTLYQGETPSQPAEFCFSLDQDIADWFANRFEAGHVNTLEVSKLDVLAYFSRRSEEEILVKPKRFAKLREALQRL